MATIRLMTKMPAMITFLEVDGQEVLSDNPLYGSYLIEYNNALIDRFNKYIGLLAADNQKIRVDPVFTAAYLEEMDKKNNGGLE